MEIPEYIEEKIKYVSEYVGTATDRWIRVKKELTKLCAPEYRSLFSRRHKTSKKQFINDLEIKIINRWQEITGIKLLFDQNELHQPSDERPPKHWAIFEYNKLRAEAIAKRENENKQ